MNTPDRSTPEKLLTMEEARAIIDREDAVILEAFSRRMEAAGHIARNKAQKGMPIYVPERERSRSGATATLTLSAW